MQRDGAWEGNGKQRLDLRVQRPEQTIREPPEEKQDRYYLSIPMRVIERTKHYRPSCSLVACSNHFPRFEDYSDWDSDAIMRRAVILPMFVSVARLKGPWLYDDEEYYLTFLLRCISMALTQQDMPVSPEMVVMTRLASRFDSHSHLFSSVAPPIAGDALEWMALASGTMSHILDTPVDVIMKRARLISPLAVVSFHGVEFIRGLYMTNLP